MKWFFCLASRFTFSPCAGAFIIYSREWRSCGWSCLPLYLNLSGFDHKAAIHLLEKRVYPQPNVLVPYTFLHATLHTCSWHLTLGRTSPQIDVGYIKIFIRSHMSSHERADQYAEKPWQIKFCKIAFHAHSLSLMHWGCVKKHRCQDSGGCRRTAESWQGQRQAIARMPTPSPCGS